MPSHDEVDPRTPQGQLLLRLSHAIGSLLQRHADQATDTDVRPAKDAQAFAERWAGHLMDGRAAPVSGTMRTATGETDATRLTMVERDWTAALNWLARDLGLERDQSAQSQQALRETVLLITSQLYQGVVEEKAETREAEQQMERLRATLTSSKIDDIKREAYGAVKFLARMNEERRERRDKHINELSRRLISIREELEVAQRQAESDRLTGVLNRAGLEKILEQTTKMHVLTGQKATMLVLDLDYFKRVNDTLGHAEGDRILKQVAKLLIMTFPRKGDMIARFGGDEFVVLLPQTTESDAHTISDRLLKNMENENWNLPIGCSIGMSIGLAEIDPIDTPADWMRRADHALLRAKREGRGRVMTSSQAQPNRLSAA